MLGKLIVSGADRATAIARWARALSEFEITGVETSLPLFRALAGDPDFLRAAFDVQWLDRRLSEGLLEPGRPAPDEVWLAAVGLAQAEVAKSAGTPASNGSTWRSVARQEALRG
jgi:acetyl-CoA carboxylase biotin carboxylase subunit